MANKRVGRNRSKRAFTLLEILVVVGICAFVAGGIGVGVTQAINDSKGKECAANLATIEGAKDEFSRDNPGVALTSIDQFAIWCTNVSGRRDLCQSPEFRSAVHV
jgi:prepilin-type N-terminal cleavage/methylation domain-containing protein